MSDDLIAVLRGVFNQKCQGWQKLRQIRLILWSTQSDFEEERENFWFEILPELQQHCLQYGADILLLDPYQGSDFDPVYQPQLLNLLFQQIHDSRAQSEGVFFVCLIGDKYGPCPLPTQLRSEELQHIRTAAFEGGKDVRPLDEWYKLDQNASPPAYVLQPSSPKKKLDPKSFSELQDVIQSGAYVAHQEGLINQVNRKFQERFFTSAVELAIENALSISSSSSSDGCTLMPVPVPMNTNNAFNWSGPTLKGNATKCLFVLRKFEGVQRNAASNLSTYVDTSTQPHFNPQEKLANLKNCLSNAIDKSNFETFRVNWEAGDAASWLRSKNRERHLEKFTHNVIYKLKHLIDRAFGVFSHKGNRRGSYSQLLGPLKGNGTLKGVFETAWLHHQYTLSIRKSKFIGRNDLMKRMRDTCKDAARRPAVPLIIQADDGAGKSAVLAEVAYQASTNWLIGSTVICRYVQLNVQSQYVHEIIRSICLQLCMAHQLEDLLKTYKEYYSADKMADWLECASAEVVKKTRQPVVILIDDIHLIKYGPQLGGKGQQNFAWLPSPLPQNVIVIGTVNLAFPLENLPIRRWDTSKGLIKLPNLSDNELLDICKSYLNPFQRTLSTDQEGFVKNIFKSTPSPVFAKFLAYEASQWASFQQMQSLTNNSGKSGGSASGLATSSLPAYLDQKFSQLEKQFGYEICQQICCYLECSHNGLTEMELFDLLTCHRDVMNKIFPEQGSARIRRFPSNLWIRFKNDLGPLISFKMADGKAVMYWSQSLISNFIRHRYLNSSSQLKKCHTDMADLFGNHWANSEHVDALNIGTEGKVTHKFVMPQPLRSTVEPIAPGSAEECVVYNIRRVQCLWYHLLHAGAVDYFEEQSLCNFEYLEAVLRATGLAHLLAIIDHALSQILNYNLHVLYGMVLRPSLAALSHDQTLFAAELIGRLRYTRGRNTAILNNLVEQAMAWVDNYSNAPLMVPLTCWIRPPLCPLVVTFKLQDWAPAAAGTWTIVQPTLNYQHLLAAGNKNSTLIWMYHIASHTLVKTFAGHQDRVIWLEISRNGQLFASSSADGTVRVWDLHQGTCVRNLNPHTDRAFAVLFTHDDQYLITSGADQTAKISCMETGRVVRTFEGHTGPITTLALTSADDYLITGSSDFTIFVWDMENGVKLSQISGLMAPVRCIQISSNDTFLMVACEDETLKVFSLCLGTEIHELRGHEGKICCMAMAVDDCQIFAGSSDGNIYCYDIHNAQRLSTQNCHSSAVTSLKVTVDGHFLISGSSENIHVWNIDRPSDHRRQEEGNHLTAIALSKDFKYGASGNFAGLIYLWDLEMCHCLWVTCDDPSLTISCLQFDQEAMNLFSGSTTGVVSVWSMADGSQLKRYENHTTPIRTIQTFSDRSRVLTHEANGTARVWIWQSSKQPAMHSSTSGIGEGDDTDRETVVELLTLKGCGDTLRLAGDKDVVAKTADADKELRIWNLNMEEEGGGVTLKAKLCHVDKITCLALTPDAKLLVTGSVDQSLKVWEGTTGYLTQVLVGHSDTIVCCAINDMCTVVVSAAADNSVFSWDVDTGAIMAAFNNHTKTVTAVLLTPDGNIALSGSKDGWIYSWATDSGQQISCYNAQLSIAEMLTTPDAHRMLIRMEQCPHLAILCLHNCPMFPEPTNLKRRRQSRAMSMTSLASTGSLSSIGSGRETGPTAASASAGTSANGSGGQAVSKEVAQLGGAAGKRPERSTLDKPMRIDRKPSKVFAQLERSRSRASLYDNPTSTTRLGPERGSKEKQANKQSAANSSSKVCVII